MEHNKNGVTIRPLQVTDAAGLSCNCFPNEPVEAVVNYIKRALGFVQRGQAAHLVAEVNGEPVANAQLICWSKRAEIGSLVVCESYHNRGIGSALIDALDKAAANLGAEQIEIGAQESNTQALDLYRRLGFVPYKKVRVQRHSRDEQIVYLIREIPPNGTQ